ncbi:MAG: hypothetical protein WBE27_01055, partial [Microgenomates group bacterium]
MNRLKRKEEVSPPKEKANPRKKRKKYESWGKKERYLVFYILLVTIILSAVLALSARSWKLPGFPRIS